MNELTDRFGDSFGVVAFPSNQFGNQTNESDSEVLNTLKYVRPGDGYEPKFPISTKIEINGDGAHPIFKWLKETVPMPSDDHAGAGADFMFTDVRKALLWTPLRRSDVVWNFEKWLINQEGRPVKRYSPKFPTIDCAGDIEKLIKDGPNALD